MEQQTNQNDVQAGTSGKYEEQKHRKFKSWKIKKIKEPAKSETKEHELHQPTPKGNFFIEDQTSINPRKQDSEPDDKAFDESISEDPSENKNEPSSSIRYEAPAYNTRYLARTMDTYCLESFQSNTLLIFNHINFENFAERISGEHDVLTIRHTFKEYNFHSENIFEYTDYDHKDIKAVVKSFSECNFTHFGCVVVVVLTHGDKDGYLRARDRIYHESELIDPFLYNSNQTLITKPKIFIIQTCGCHREMAGIAGMCATDSMESDDEDPTLPLIYTQPKEADILIIYGIHAGAVSSCDEAKGSWLIKSLCSNIAKYAETEHFEDILTEVKDNAATENPETGNTELHVVSMSTLIRKLYFTKSCISQDID